MKGFTLVELLVVVLIIGVLTSIALPQYRRAVRRAKFAEALQMLPALYDARDRFITEHQCVKGNNALVCADGTAFNAKMLDIETKGTVNGMTIETSNFAYIVFGTHTCKEEDLWPVEAIPAWTEFNHVQPIHLCYNGTRVCCEQVGSGFCEKYNVERCPTGS